MWKCTKYNEFSSAKSPYVDDGSRLAVDGSDTLADVPLLKLVEPNVEVVVVGVNVRGDR